MKTTVWLELKRQKLSEEEIKRIQEQAQREVERLLKLEQELPEKPKEQD